MPPPRDLPPPVLVQDARGLEALLAHAEEHAVIAVDTEADSFYNYREKVCLVQLTIDGKDYLVDPLAELSLEPLGRLMADPERLKVFHDGEYDVLILKRDFAFEFSNLFDTRVAAAALGNESPGLASVLNEAFGIELDKSLQRSDWSRRPLTPEQVDYARLDTHYLVPLMERLVPELEERGRTRIVEGMCLRLEGLEPVERSFNPDEFIRIKGARDLDPLGQRMLRELYVLRDELAREADRPPFKILSNKVLVEVAQLKPRHSRELKNHKGLSPRLLRRSGALIMEAVTRALEDGPLERPPHLPSKDGTGELDDQAFELYERLRDWRKERARQEGIESSLVLSRHTLLDIARCRPRTREALAGVDDLQGWQFEEYGDPLLELVGQFHQDAEAGKLSPGPRHKNRRR